MERGKLPDCSRGFSPAAAKMYIERLNAVGQTLDAATASHRRVTAQRDEANNFILELREANELFSVRNSELNVEIVSLGTRNSALHMEIEALKRDRNRVNIERWN